MRADLWEVRTLPDGLTLELQASDSPALVLVQDGRRIRVDLPHVRGVVAALAEVLAAGDVYHA
jgi:hypothetical protein